MTIDEKHQKLREIIAGCGKLAVAFSGGVDSSFLLKAAHDVLGDRVLAVTADSVFIPRAEIHEARDFCQIQGIRQRIVRIDVLSVAGVKDNPADRCYHCKRGIFERMLSAAADDGIAVVAEGSNVDDEGDYRPGMRAIQELSVRSPLKEAGLNKAEIRELSRRLGLNTWDKPSMACLASRVPYGEELNCEKLRRVEQAEESLHGLGIVQCRVRCHGMLARIEVLPADFNKILQEPARTKLIDSFKQFGFSYVSLDLKGFRSGSMNETLNNKNSHA